MQSVKYFTSNLLNVHPRRGDWIAILLSGIRAANHSYRYIYINKSTSRGDSVKFKNTSYFTEEDNYLDLVGSIKAYIAHLSYDHLW